MAKKRQAVESDSQDSAEEESVIEDKDLEKDFGWDDGIPATESRQHSGAAAKADVTTAMPLESGVHSQIAMDGYKHFGAGPSSATHQAQSALPHSIADEKQDTGGTEAAPVTHSMRSDADQGSFPLLDAMVQPDMSAVVLQLTKLRPSGSPMHAEHKSAHGQQQEALISDTLVSSGHGPDAPPSRPPQKGSLRDRSKAFAALSMPDSSL